METSWSIVEVERSLSISASPYRPFQNMLLFISTVFPTSLGFPQTGEWGEELFPTISHSNHMMEHFRKASPEAIWGRTCAYLSTTRVQNHIIFRWWNIQTLLRGINKEFFTFSLMSSLKAYGKIQSFGLDITVRRKNDSVTILVQFQVHICCIFLNGNFKTSTNTL